MPCNSDYMNATVPERALTAAFQLLDELDGKPIDPHKYANGYDPRAYGHASKELLDNKVRELCARLANVDVSKQSLEMQIWWRDHLRADAERVAREKIQAEEQQRRDTALAKLSPEERKALGVR